MKNNTKFDALLELESRLVAARALAALGVCIDTRARGAADVVKVNAEFDAAWANLSVCQIDEFFAYRAQRMATA